MFPSVCLSNDHSLGTGFPLLELQLSRSATVDSRGSAAISPGFVTDRHTNQSDSPAYLNLVVDLSSYPLQQYTVSGSPSSRPAVH
jgi:hypothetical protein